MRERARDKGRLEDIVEYSENVTKLIKGITLEEFVADICTYYAVMKNIEIVGEAAYKLTKAFKKEHRKTPWEKVQGMRHVLVHEYAQVVPRILWGTATEGIPELRQQVERYLAETDWEAWENVPDEFCEREVVRYFDDDDDDLYSSYAHEPDGTPNYFYLIIAQKMKEEGCDIQRIMEATELTEEDLAGI